MQIFESIKVALNMLRLHKLRALLTMLGVIIGVMSVTLVIMVSSGFKSYMTDQFTKLGADTIMIFYDPGQNMRGQTVGNIEGLKADDVQYLLDHCSNLETASGLYQVPLTKMVVGDLDMTAANVVATDEKQAIVSRVAIVEGRGLTAQDVAQRTNICVIGEDVRDKLFPGKTSIGQYITFNGITLQVVGVMDVVEIFGQNNKKDVWVPISTAQDKWVGGKTLSRIYALPKKGVNSDDAMDDIWAALMQRSNNRRVYRVDSRQTIISTLGNVVTIAGVVLAMVAALSLLVGGIGIMNIMLVSVTERTKEVGLRKALGARKSAVLGQFLVEAAILSMVGGIIGMSIAFVTGLGVTALTAHANWPSKGGLQTPFPLAAAIGSMIFSALIGMVFGLYPAVRASSLSPIEALRTE